MDKKYCALWTLLAAGLLTGCGGSGSAPSAVSQQPPPPPVVINGLQTPKSVSVVTAN